MWGFFRKQVDNWRRVWNGRALEAQQKQLVQLYWNRVELKKELSKALAESNSLRQQLQQHQEARRIADDKLLRLEQFLGDPANGHHASVHFQLRQLWRVGKEMIAQFSSELVRLQEEQERVQHENQHQLVRGKSLEELGQSVESLQSQLEQLSVQLASSAEQQSKLTRPWHHFKRGKLTTFIETLNVRYLESQDALHKAKDDYAALNNEAIPLFSGISIAGKRLINTAVLAYAEWLLVNVASLALAALAREAMKQPVEDARYGDAASCEAIKISVSSALQRLGQVDPGSQEFIERTKALRGRAVYPSSVDTAPTEASLGFLQQQQTHGADALIHRLNVLSDNYWDVAQFLLR